MPTPAQSITNALNAYNEALKGPKPGAKQDTQPSADEFGNLVRGAIQEAKRIGERSEKLSIQGITDKADIGQVVTAVAEAEVTLQTVVVIRDKVIDAYKDIIRMPI